MKQSFLFFAMLLFVSAAFSQPTQVWEARYNAPANGRDISEDMAMDGQGNIYVTGTTTGASGRTDITTIKYNSAGVQQWTATYNGPSDSNDYVYKIALDNQGNVYLAGESQGINTKADFTVIKYNTAGVEQWVKRLNGAYNNDDSAEDIAIDAQGNVYVTGFLNDGSPTYDKYLTIKYSPDGTVLWQNTYNGPSLTDEAKFITLDADGNVIVTGESGSGTTNNTPDYLTIKYNSAGIQQWIARTGVFYRYETVSGVVTDPAGNVYITGTEERGSDSVNYLTVKYNAAGAQQWSQRFLGEDQNRDIAMCIVSDQNGNIFITGSSSKAGEGQNTGTVKYNTNGVLQWAAYFRGFHQTIVNQSQYPFDMKIDAEGNVYVCGYDYSTAYISKYNSSGVLQWFKNYGPTSGDDAFYAMVLDMNNNIFVTGPSYGSAATSFEYATLKYSQPIGISPISGEMPTEFSLSQNYPNPFNPVTNIEFSVPKSSFVKLTVFDVTGRELETLVSQTMSPGTYKADWDASKYSSGVFFYTLTTDGFTQTKKMMLIK